MPLNAYKTPYCRDLKQKNQHGSRTDLSLVADKSSILSTQKKVLVCNKEPGFSRKSSLKSWSTKQTVGTVANALKKALQTKEQDPITFEPTFTFQNIDLSCVDERISPQKPQEKNLTKFHEINNGSTFGCKAASSGNRQMSDNTRRSAEPFLFPSARYLAKFSTENTNITLSMRAVLLNWIAEVTELFMLKREVFHFAVNYLDRYLDSVELKVEKSKFQLLGLVCLYLACKFEVRLPLIRNRSTDPSTTF